VLPERETSIFIGVLTHPDSRFSLSQFELLFANLAKAGVDAQLTICKENLATQEEKVITRGLAIRTRFRESILLIRWYLRLPNHSARFQGIVNTTFSWERTIRALFSSGGLERAQKSLIRLKNISLGHAKLWSQALESKTDWVLILEDDASPIEISTTHDQLVRLIDFLAVSTKQTPNVYCDLSLSFNSAQLGIEVSGQPVLVLGDQVLHGVSRPFSNTVCAVLMSRPMLQSLSEAVQDYIQSPAWGYLPIDWLVNKFFLESPGKLEPTSFFNLEPGLFIQESFRLPQQVNTSITPK
jgi:hypothetical protein